MLGEACSGDSAHELRDSDTRLPRWAYSLLIKDVVRGSREPHPRAADARAKSLFGMSAMRQLSRDGQMWIGSNLGRLKMLQERAGRGLFTRQGWVAVQ